MTTITISVQGLRDLIRQAFNDGRKYNQDHSPFPEGQIGQYNLSNIDDYADHVMKELR